MKVIFWWNDYIYNKMGSNAYLDKHGSKNVKSRIKIYGNKKNRLK